MIHIDYTGNFDNIFIEKTNPIKTFYTTNSGTRTTDVYISVDYNNTESTAISLSTSYSGTYISMNTSITIDGVSRLYNIHKGSFDNIKNDSINNRGLIISDKSLYTGSYVSPVVSIKDREINNVIFDVDIPENTDINFYYRGCDVEPLGIDEIYWRESYKTVLNHKLDNPNEINLGSWGITPLAICFDPASKNIFVSYDNYVGAYYYSGTYNNKTSSSNSYEFDDRMRCYGGRIWGVNSDNKLIVLNNSLQTTYLSFDFISTSGLFDFAPIQNTASGIVWFTDKSRGNLNLLNVVGDEQEIVYVIELGIPRALCATNDMGCWVIDDDTKEAYRYNLESNLVKTASLNTEYKSVTATADEKDGFWYSSFDRVVHINSDGTELLNLYYTGVTRIFIGYKKVFLYIRGNDNIKVIDHLTGDILYDIPGHSYPSKTYTNLPGIFSISYEEAENIDADITAPLSHDSYWGPDGSLGWIPVNSGDYLYGFKYYQFKADFASNDGITSPILKDIKVTKGIKLSNIKPNETKNFYLKVVPNEYENLPEGDYSFNLNYTWETDNAQI